MKALHTVISLTASCYSIVNAFSPSIAGLGSPPSLPSNNKKLDVASRNNDEQSTTSSTASAISITTRREILQKSVINYSTFLLLPSLASASNLPSNTGADISKTGSIDTLTPIVSIQRGITDIKLQFTNSKEVVTPESCSSLLQKLLQSTPREETAFKRIFDAYSTPVSYKQKFLDQNAFLVYYTKGYDGPGRTNIEEDDAESTVQKMQYGSRNDAWAAMDDLFVELEYGRGAKDSSALSSGEELIALFDKVLGALDSYLSLAPVADVEEAGRRLGR